MLAGNSIALYPASVVAYAASLLICCLLAQVAKKSGRGSFAFAVAIVLSFFVGLRSIGVGIDTMHFYEHFNSSMIFGVERGFVLFMRMVRDLGGSFNVVILTCSVVTYSLTVFRLYVPYSMNTFRQFVVVAVLFWASRYFFRDQYFRYVLITLFCVFIHKTALLGLGLFFLLPFRLKRLSGGKRTIGLLFSVLLPSLPLLGAGLLFGDSLFSSYSQYLLMGGTGNTGLMPILKLVFIASIFFFSGEKSPWMSLLPSSVSRGIAAIAVVGIALEYLNVFSPYLDRIALYFSIYQIVLFSMLYKASTGELRLYVSAGTAVMSLYVLFVSLASNGHGIMPYSLTLFGN